MFAPTLPVVTVPLLSTWLLDRRQSTFIESFKGHLKQDLLETESFNSLVEAQLLLEDCASSRRRGRPDDPTLALDQGSVLVIRGVGPIGYPSMQPSWCARYQ